MISNHSNKSINSNMYPRATLQIFISIFVITFILADSITHKNDIQNNNNDNHNHNNHRRYFAESNEKTRAAIEELNEVLRHLFPVVPRHRSYMLSSKQRGIWIEPYSSLFSLKSSKTDNSGGHHSISTSSSSSSSSWISHLDSTEEASSNRDDLSYKDQQQKQTLDQKLGSSEVLDDILQLQQQQQKSKPHSEHQQSNVPSIIEVMDHNDNNNNNNPLESSFPLSINNIRIIHPKQQQSTTTSLATSLSSSSKNQESSSINGEDSILLKDPNQIRNRLSELLKKHLQKHPNRQLQRRPFFPSKTTSSSSSTTLGKRGPECMRRCILQGLLHPVQCHSLC